MSLAIADLGFLRSRCAGIVVTPADSGWDEARQAWNLAVTSTRPPWWSSRARLT